MVAGVYLYDQANQEKVILGLTRVIFRFREESLYTKEASSFLVFDNYQKSRNKEYRKEFMKQFCRTG